MVTRILCTALAFVQFIPSSMAATAAVPDVNDIVQRSVANNNANWKAAPRYSFQEHDVVLKGGSRSSRTFEVTMLDGSPYEKTIAVNGVPLGSAALKREDEKLHRELQRRQSESANARRKRISDYQKGRRQDHALMTEMIRAFHFKLGGREVLNGRQCFRVEASPRPDYIPSSRDTKVLSGMRGTLWIDADQYQWVKVIASVFRPVAFGLFIAHVEPGTEFELEEAPVDGTVWLPVHFKVSVNATILFWSKHSVDDDTYTNYQRTVNAD